MELKSKASGETASVQGNQTMKKIKNAYFLLTVFILLSPFCPLSAEVPDWYLNTPRAENQVFFAEEGPTQGHALAKALCDLSRWRTCFIISNEQGGSTNSQIDGMNFSLQTTLCSISTNICTLQNSVLIFIGDSYSYFAEQIVSGDSNGANDKYYYSNKGNIDETELFKLLLSKDHELRFKMDASGTEGKEKTIHIDKLVWDATESSWYILIDVSK